MSFRSFPRKKATVSWHTDPIITHRHAGEGVITKKNISGDIWQSFRDHIKTEENNELLKHVVYSMVVRCCVCSHHEPGVN